MTLNGNSWGVGLVEEGRLNVSCSHQRVTEDRCSHVKEEVATLTAQKGPVGTVVRGTMETWDVAGLV